VFIGYFKIVVKKHKVKLFGMIECNSEKNQANILCAIEFSLQFKLFKWLRNNII